MKSIKGAILCLAILSGWLAGCAGQNQPSTPGGRSLFEKSMLGPNLAPGCVTCHSLEPGMNLVGPSLAGVAGLAASRQPGMSAEQYLRQSILDPDAYIVEDYIAGVMYAKYAEDLTEGEINDLVTFLLTLK
ncbi:MAG: cytochrome c [Anaerolineales bacterium]|nr:cytochrome c [Anaerolineales bacterium]